MNEVFGSATRKHINGGVWSVLVTLANLVRAPKENPHNRSCWPARSTIAHKTGMTERNVTFALRRLEEAGIIEISPGEEWNSVSTYTIRPVTEWKEVKKLREVRGGERRKNCANEAKKASERGEKSVTTFSPIIEEPILLTQKEPREREEPREEPAGKATAPSPFFLIDENFLEELQARPEYAYLDVAWVSEKYHDYCRQKRLQPTRTGLKKFLKTERPESGNGKAPTFAELEARYGHNGKAQTASERNAQLRMQGEFLLSKEGREWLRENREAREATEADWREDPRFKGSV